MLAHKADGEHPAGYSDLLLAVQKLGRRAEAQDPLLPKTATVGRSNATHSQTSGNLFCSQKLKGNCTFPAQSATIGNNEVEEDSGVKPEGKKRLSHQLGRT